MFVWCYWLGFSSWAVFPFLPFASALSYHDIFQLRFRMISLLHAELSTFEPFSFNQGAFNCVRTGQFNSESEVFLAFPPIL